MASNMSTLSDEDEKPIAATRREKANIHALIPGYLLFCPLFRLNQRARSLRDVAVADRLFAELELASERRDYGR